MKFIEKGWQGYRKACVPANATEAQVTETKQAFFAGAAILFTTMMNVMDEDKEPTDADLHAMADIQKEIDDFGQSLDRKVFGQINH